MCVYFCGGSCVEDASSHLVNHLSLHPNLRTCSAAPSSGDKQTRLEQHLLHFGAGKRWQRRDIRRHVQRVRVEQAAKIFHGRKPLCSSSSQCRPSGARPQGNACLTSIPTITPMPASPRQPPAGCFRFESCQQRIVSSRIVG